MSISNIFKCSIEDIAAKGSKISFGEKAKKEENSKEAIIMEFKNPQAAAEADISKIIYIPEKLTSKLEAGCSIVLDSEKNKTIYNKAETRNMLKTISGEPNVIMQLFNTLAADLKSKIKSSPELSAALPSIESDNLFGHKLENTTSEISTKVEIELPQEETKVKEEVSNKKKRGFNKR